VTIQVTLSPLRNEWAFFVLKAQPFTIGGYECDYPGDDALPPEERCRCRRTVVAAFADDQSDDE
jgi:hypothetical protein